MLTRALRRQAAEAERSASRRLVLPVPQAVQAGLDRLSPAAVARWDELTDLLGSRPTSVRGAAQAAVSVLPPPPQALMQALPRGASAEVVTACGAALLLAATLFIGAAIATALRRMRGGGGFEGAPPARWLGLGGGGADAAAGAADAVANLQRRVRNVQSALAVMPADWREQRAPLEAKLAQLSSELARALAHAERLAALPGGLASDWEAAKVAHGSGGAAAALAAQLVETAAGTAALAAPPPPLARPPPPQQPPPPPRPPGRATSALAWLRAALPKRQPRPRAFGLGGGSIGGALRGTASERVALLERRLEALEALQVARGAADAQQLTAAAEAAAASAPWARATTARLAALEARLTALGASQGGAPWEAGDRAIQRQVAILEAALAARSIATDAGAPRSPWPREGIAEAMAGDCADAGGGTSGTALSPDVLPPTGWAMQQQTPQQAPSKAPEAAALVALEARVDYLAAVLSVGAWSGGDVASRIAALEAAAAAQAQAAAALAAQVEASAEAMRTAIAQLQTAAAAERAAARSELAQLTMQLASTEEALMSQLQEAFNALPAPKNSTAAAVLPTGSMAGSPATQELSTSAAADDEASGGPVDASATRMEQGREIMLQGFNWESHHAHGGAPLFRRLRDRVADIAGMGFTAVWLPPACQSLSPQGYLPQDFYNLNTSYGSEKDLRALLREMLEVGLLPIADVVLNHRCATKKGRDGKWNRFDGIPMAWDESCITRDNWDWSGTGARGTGEDFPIAPNIDHTNERVKADLRKYLAWLRKDVGFRGLRLDFVKGYAASFAADYITTFQAEFAVGELWTTLSYRDGALEWNQDAHRQATINWVDATGGVATAFDFTTKGVLQEACARGEWWRLRDGSGRPPGVIGLWPSRAVTFIDNHDTGSTQAHWPFPAERVTQGYAYILSHPGTPSVLWDHLFQWGDDVSKAVRALVAARRNGGITSRAKVTIHVADANNYAATVGARLAVRLGAGQWAPQGSQWQHACSGGHGQGHWCVWLKP